MISFYAYIGGSELSLVGWILFKVALISKFHFWTNRRDIWPPGVLVALIPLSMSWPRVHSDSYTVVTKWTNKGMLQEE